MIAILIMLASRVSSGDSVTPVNESAFRGDLAMRSLFDRLILAVAMDVFRFEVAVTAVSLGRLQLLLPLLSSFSVVCLSQPTRQLRRLRLARTMRYHTRHLRLLQSNGSAQAHLNSTDTPEA
jgi:hypothetical protein